MTRDPRLPPGLTDTAIVVLALLDVASAGERQTAAYVLSFVAALGLWARRRTPYLSFTLAMGALYFGVVLVTPLVALYTVAALRPDKRALAGCAVIAALGYYLPWPLSRLHWHGLPNTVSELIYTAAFVGAPVALGLLARTRSELADRLADVRSGQEREKHYLTERVLGQERARLAREMHDVVSHQVSLIAVQAGALTATSPDKPSRQAAEAIRELSVRTLDELRQMVGVLRRSGGEPVPLAPQPSLADIARLVHDSGERVHLDIARVPSGARTEAAERAAFRVVQEALTNVRKHAPGADVVVRVVPDRSGLKVSVRNGPPSEPAGRRMPVGGHGLVGLRERAELLGGDFHAGPTADGGFLVAASLPYVSRGGGTADHSS